MMYVSENPAREVKTLDGIWRFKIDEKDVGYEEEWFATGLSDTISMPVPSSYNDITTDESVRDFIGNAWYERRFYVPLSWKNRRIVLRFGSATNRATVWVNGKLAVSHEGGYLPFEADITDIVSFENENMVIVAVDNRLDWSCLPSGEIKTYETEGDNYPQGYITQETYFDFYNYSGLHRPVKLYTTPKRYITNITVKTNICNSDGIISYDVELSNENNMVKVFLYDEDNLLIEEKNGCRGEILIPNVKVWEPGNAYLYKLTVKTYGNDGSIEDCYEQSVGVRTIEVKDGQFLINGKPFYFKGFGKHEDSDIHGKGLDNALNVKDFNLMKWIGANSFRTSHYPYSEELLNLADREGMVVIGEVPAVGMCFWSDTNAVFAEGRVDDKTLKNHINTMREMIERDKNHPCIVMWSIANEAATNEENSVPYFTAVANKTKLYDPTRPIMIVQTVQPEEDKVGQLVDVIGVNRYKAWYSDHGHYELIERQLDLELTKWYKKYGKPIIFTEFGADAIAGFHQIPPVTFTEEFQCECIKCCQASFDKHEFVIGEHVWAFADFATKQGLTRVVGNKKGVFTRQRHPKAAAHMLKDRWTSKHKKW